MGLWFDVLDWSWFYCLLMVLILLWLLFVMRLLLILVVAFIVFVIVWLLILLSLRFVKGIVIISVLLSAGIRLERNFFHRCLFLSIVILFIILGFSVHVILIMPSLLFVHLFHVSFN